MIKKIALIAAASASTLVALPAAAQAQSRYDSRYERDYRGGSNARPYRYQRGDRYYGNQRVYARGYGDQGGRYYDQRSRYGRECSGTVGTVVGGVAGALLGDAAVGRRGDGTAGALIGGAIGALAGRAIDKGDCR